jgi:hypothetical protein
MASLCTHVLRKSGVRAYLNQIGRVALLTAGSEVELAKRVEAALARRGGRGATEHNDAGSGVVAELTDDHPLHAALVDCPLSPWTTTASTERPDGWVGAVLFSGPPAGWLALPGARAPSVK